MLNFKKTMHYAELGDIQSAQGFPKQVHFWCKSYDQQLSI